MLLVACALSVGAMNATKNETKVQCTATTKAGAQCKKTAKEGTKLCSVHTPVPANERCAATTKKGEQCKRRHNESSKFCTQHQKLNKK